MKMGTVFIGENSDGILPLASWNTGFAKPLSSQANSAIPQKALSNYLALFSG